MPPNLNLIADPWIPVRTASGGRVIRPDQIAEAGVLAPDWPRADLNLGCYELLIGLVALAAPPAEPEDWDEGAAPDPERLRAALAAYAPAFDLLGDGPRFMQDKERLEASNAAKINTPDMLFLDSAGGQTAKFNADLMVKRARYPTLDLPLAAMALYTFQAHAPSGGAGNRTSMRGGGPMVCLVDPRAPESATPLWDMVWANVPDGAPAGVDALPWTRPTQTSEKGKPKRTPDMAHEIEAWFGMPRRLRLIAGVEGVTGVVQRPYGANYAGWIHPATPYRRTKQSEPFLPRRPSAEPVSYRDWIGVVLHDDEADLQRRPRTLTTFEARHPMDLEAQERMGVVVGGWAMDNMKPQDFTLSRQPIVTLDADRRARLIGLIEAGVRVADALRRALKPAIGAEKTDAPALAAVRGEFLRATQPALEGHLAAMRRGDDADDIAAAWLRTLRPRAMELFDARALQGLADHRISAVEPITTARRRLLSLLNGYGKDGGALFDELGLPAPPPKPKKKEPA